MKSSGAKRSLQSRARGPAAPERTNKAKMAQERSQLTRRSIVKAAVQLWTQRGFEAGFDATTVDEIAAQAGVSRPTVYYYFPKKEDMLRELAWMTAEDTYRCALQAMMSGQSVDTVLDEVMQHLGEGVVKTERAVVKRVLQVRSVEPETISRDTAGGLTRTFSVILAHAQEVGELPRNVSCAEVAEILSSICTASITKWSILGDFDLAATLRRRAAFTLAGARAFEAPVIDSP